jgi:broad specificity phosphatase PhoE
MTARMTTRITLLCQPSTAALRAGRFPADEPADSGRDDDLASLAAGLGKPDLVLCSPSRCAVDTAGVLGLSPTIAADLHEVDYGRWAGLSLKQIAVEEPDAIAAWLADPEMTAHGGESLRAAVERVGRWIDQYAWPAGHALVIAPASVVKAVVLHVLTAPVSAHSHLDIVPLGTIALSRQQGKWRLALGEPRR